jgi:hypothetical protein
MKSPVFQCRFAVAALLLACLAGAATAQTPAPTPAPVPPSWPSAAAVLAAEARALQLAQAGIDGPVFIGAGGGAFFGGPDAAPDRIVKGAPYCAEAEHETVQWLADGAGGASNRITRRNSTMLCRDGEGRTRQEVDRGGRVMVYLRDPVARQSWLLDPERKTARPLGDARPGGVEAAMWSDYAERMRAWARGGVMRTPPTAPVPPTPPTPPLPVVVEPAAAAGAGDMRREVHIIRMGRDGAPGAENLVPPPAVQWRAQVLAPRGTGSVQPLPAKDIEGVRANGERSTWVIEAGKVGNDKPIQVVREVWTSPELMVTLQTRDFDPRSGEVNYRLKNLKRAEPDAALMRVPADYTQPAPKTQPRAPSAPNPKG